MNHETHTQHIMSETNSFYIRNCSCGVFHLCFGFTTLNLTAAALIAVTETLKEVCADMINQSQKPPIQSPTPTNIILGKFPITWDFLIRKIIFLLYWPNLPRKEEFRRSAVEDSEDIYTTQHSASLGQKWDHLPGTQYLAQTERVWRISFT